MSDSNLRKISDPVAHLDFFFSLSHGFFRCMYGINLAFFLGGDRFVGPEFFLRFEADLDFQKSRCRLKGRV